MGSWKVQLMVLSSYLSEEFSVPHILANLYESMFLAEIINFEQLRIIASLEFFLKTYSSSLHPYLNISFITKDLVKTKLIPRIIGEDFPIVYKINQFVVTFHDLQREFKNNLAPSWKLLVTPLHGVSL